jgi:hypothetical protein
MTAVSGATGLCAALGMGIGGWIWRKFEPFVDDTAKKIDDYLISHPIQTNEKEILLSSPEVVVFWGGIIGGLTFFPPAIPVGVIGSALMRIRRIYAQNGGDLLAAIIAKREK